MVHDCVVWGSVILLPDKEGECGGVEERRKWQDKVVKALQTANKIKKRGSSRRKRIKTKSIFYTTKLEAVMSKICFLSFLHLFSFNLPSSFVLFSGFSLPCPQAC